MRLVLAIALCSCFLGCVSRDAGVSQRAPVAAPAEIKVGMTAEEVIQSKGRHFKINYHRQVGSVHMVYDDIRVDVRDWAWSRPGRVVGVSATTDEMKEGMKSVPYEDEKEETIPN